MGQISVQRQRLLEFGNALGRAVRKDLDFPQAQMSQGMVRSEGQSIDQSRFRRREVRSPIVGL
jgi:hypothetical protein